MIRWRRYSNLIQEVEPRCAEALCRLFPSDPSVDIMSIAKKAKKAIENVHHRDRNHVHRFRLIFPRHYLSNLHHRQ